MKHRISNNQRLLQKLRLTPQMRQSIKLLGMSTKDLNEFIESALVSNPFLKKEYKKEPYQKNLSSGRPTEDFPDYVSNIQQKEDPRTLLLSQLRMLDFDDKELEIAEYLIGEMDDSGYIKIDLEEAAEILSVDIEEVEKGLGIIQRMEPAGIGARDAHECLQLQLERMKKKNSTEYTIVTDFMEELAKNDVNKISKSLNMDKEKILTAIKNIKKLNPQPASNIFSKKAQIVMPDLIAKIKNNKLSLGINREWLPNLEFYNPYENDADISEDPQAKKFIKEAMESAKHLISNLTRREETIFDVAAFIIKFQIDHLTDEVHEPKSLTSKDVAAALKLHTSTISRVVSNKYIQIDNRVIPLKSLLSKGMKNHNGEITAKSAVKQRIGLLIKNEDKARPLSDDAIRSCLEKGGITVKRRTIAKYRNALRIPPGHLRKKFKTD